MLQTTKCKLVEINLLMNIAFVNQKKKIFFGKKFEGRWSKKNSHLLPINCFSFHRNESNGTSKTKKKMTK